MSQNIDPAALCSAILSLPTATTTDQIESMLAQAIGKKWAKLSRTPFTRVHGLVHDLHAVSCKPEIDGLVLILHRMIATKLESQRLVAAIKVLSSQPDSAEKTHLMLNACGQQEVLSTQISQMPHIVTLRAQEISRALQRVREAAENTYTLPTLKSFTPDKPINADPVVPVDPAVRAMIEDAMATSAPFVTTTHI